MKENPAAVAFLKENGFKVTRYANNPEIFSGNPAFIVYEGGGCYMCTGYCIDGMRLCQYIREFSELREAKEIQEKIKDIFCYPTVGEKRNVLVEKYIASEEDNRDSDLPF